MIKIGTTQRMAFRLPQLEADEGCELEVLGVAEGRYAKEKELHRRFAGLRKDGEWFEPGDELMSFVGENTETWDRDENTACVVAFRCTTAYREHLNSIAEEETRLPVQVIQRALQAYSKANGYGTVPKP